MTTTIESFVSSLDLESSRVLSPELIFLCGGEISTEETEEHSGRGLFLAHLDTDEPGLRSRVVLAEKVIKYFEQSKYTDLLTFERELAELAFLTIVFVESAGSIAELGSFSVLEEIHTRLMIVVPAEHSDCKSFIWHGPVAYLKNEVVQELGNDAIYVYDWDRAAGEFPDAGELSQHVLKISEQAVKTKAFNREKIGHILLLIQELVGIQRICREHEILEQLGELKIACEKVQVGRWISLLASLGYLVRRHHGNNVFYVATDQPRRVQLSFEKEAAIKDTARWQTAFLEEYEELQPRKLSALRAHHRLAQGGDTGV